MLSRLAMGYAAAWLFDGAGGSSDAFGDMNQALARPVRLVRGGFQFEAARR
jgi:hypothetical protein